tara:strand:+ start:2792 stop:3097 length:306 start_codon:yes stop_codon:yes gene_type:complete
MRCFTLKVYANSEYALSDRLKEIQFDINKTIWPSCPFTKKVRKLKESSYIQENTEFHLSDYEYDKENPNWGYGRRLDTVGKWQMQIVKDEEYVNFQKSEEL